MACQGKRPGRRHTRPGVELGDISQVGWVKLATVLMGRRKPAKPRRQNLFSMASSIASAEPPQREVCLTHPTMLCQFRRMQLKRHGDFFGIG